MGGERGEASMAGKRGGGGAPEGLQVAETEVIAIENDKVRPGRGLGGGGIGGGGVDHG